ncbi:MAG: dihydrodipicolinate synthase family protein [Alistipes sp.]|nr:dihydrodipicolinate synthase family protein [Alistipes sp.]
MKKHKLSGVGAAMITPFKSDFSCDYDTLSRMIDYVIDGGTNYIVALGSTAETATLSHEEHALLPVCPGKQKPINSAQMQDGAPKTRCAVFCERG